ncbi:MAG: hypothetical protein HC905_14155 [Bacteroidales bacterium]|nr:hypothetical protein [Bacteroidales bacterium]
MKNLNNDLSGFTGTESYYRYSKLFYNYLLTDGVLHAAENYGLYWFMDVICSYQGEEKMKAEEFQVWKLKRIEDDRFKVTADDGNGNILQFQDIEFSDFTEDEFTVYLIDKIILLPSEN